MQPRWIVEKEVEERLTMGAVIGAVEQSFRAWAEGRAANGPRRRVRSPGAVLHSMAATAPYLGLAGWKQYLTTPSGTHFLVGLYRLDSAQLIALIEASRLGQMRTGAATAVALRYLAPQRIAKLALIGSGYQAQTQLMAAAAVCRIDAVAVFSRTPEHRERFARWASQTLGLNVVLTTSVADAVRDAAVLITATTSSRPVVEDRHLPESLVMVAMGSNWPDKAELDIATIRSAEVVVCDSVEACQLEAGELIQAVEQRVFDWTHAIELRDIVAGRCAVPKARRILFKSVGLALEDVATGALLLS